MNAKSNVEMSDATRAAKRSAALDRGVEKFEAMMARVNRHRAAAQACDQTESLRAELTETAKRVGELQGRMDAAKRLCQTTADGARAELVPFARRVLEALEGK